MLQNFLDYVAQDKRLWSKETLSFFEITYPDLLRVFLKSVPETPSSEYTVKLSPLDRHALNPMSHFFPRKSSSPSYFKHSSKTLDFDSPEYSHPEKSGSTPPSSSDHRSLLKFRTMLENSSNFAGNFMP